MGRRTLGARGEVASGGLDAGTGRAALEPWYRAMELVIRPPFRLWFTWRFDGVDRVPPEGPLIVAGNHLSYLDPFAHAFFVVEAGRRPRFLAKQELFDRRVVGAALRAAGQIPVRRGTGDRSPLEGARAALESGEVVVLYPEGTTTTTSSDFSPGPGRTGAARLSISTGVPILPVATWGGQYVWRRSGRQSLAFGRPIWLLAGEPIAPGRRSGTEPEAAGLRERTDALMTELAELVGRLRDRYPARWARG